MVRYGGFFRKLSCPQTTAGTKGQTELKKHFFSELEDHEDHETWIFVNKNTSQILHKYITFSYVMRNS